jgi:serine/threonine-protein phosphatase 6 regulatory ankyrin repeat subunit B
MVLAACQSDIAKVQAALSSNLDINSLSEHKGEGMTSLMAASLNGKEDMVKFLIDKGADVNAKANDGTTALMMASEEDQKEVVPMLLAKGADVNAKSKEWSVTTVGDLGALKTTHANGTTALMVASQSGYKDIVKQLLLAKGIDVNAKSEKGQTALSLALSRLKVLRENGLEWAGKDLQDIVKLLEESAK